jgi:hypothetical protein
VVALYEGSDIREHAVQIEFLLIAGAADGHFSLTPAAPIPET